jgi:hypothetical protein
MGAFRIGLAAALPGLREVGAGKTKPRGPGFEDVSSNGSEDLQGKTTDIGGLSRGMVEPDGIEPTTSSMPLKRSPN